MKQPVGTLTLIGLMGLLMLAACAGSGAASPAAPQATLPAAPGPATAYPVLPTPPVGLATAYPVLPTPPVGLATAYPGQLATTAAPAVGYPAPSTPPSADLDAIGRQAAADLAQKLSVDVSQIQVTSAEATDWPDTSLGCPQAGMAYAQVVTPGYRVVLTYKQTQYDYHANQRGLLVLCQPK